MNSSSYSFDDYQVFARTTAIYPSQYGVLYTALGLTNEAGEVAGKIKKSLRDGIDTREATLDELGDVLWYAAMLAHELGERLSDVAARNVGKLTDRADRGVLGGSGDRR